MNITFPSNSKEIIDGIRAAIGRNVDFVTVSGYTNCPASGCSLDIVSQTSTNSFCLTCSGMYYIPVYETETILAHITWGNDEIMQWESAGKWIDGSCRVAIEYSDTNMTILDKTNYLVVDGKKLEINKKLFRGVQPLNRVLLDLKEFGEE